MKILEIAFKNLNSLRGEWRINLSDSAYTSNGIFAITGPTGAGKTTIFDAICLALYGQTPRLGRIGGQNNEIMSRHTDDCYARVIFETNGRKYICIWSQAQTGNKKQLQSASHKLAKFPGGNRNIITEKLNETRSKVEEITGMDFARFTQAMMLEQGGFDAFIRADKNERAAVLELITGTEIYSRISRMVFERSKEENRKLSEYELRLSENSKFFQNGTPETVKAELESALLRRKELEAEFAAVSAAREWHKELQTLRTAIDSINDSLSHMQIRLDNFEPKRRRLDAGERAMSISADYSVLTQLRKNCGKSRTECARLSGEIAQCEAEISRIVNERIPKAEAELARSKGNITESPEVLKAEIFSAVSSYEQIMQDIKTLTKTLNEHETAYSEARIAAKNALSERDNARQKMDSASHEYSLAADELVQAHVMTTAAVLDEERQKLRPGTPCPLCGSLDHPLAEHNHEDSENSEELFSRIDKLRIKAQNCKAAYDSASGEFRIADEKYTQALTAENAAKNYYERSADELRKKKEERESLHKAVSEAIKPLNFSGIKCTEDIKTRVRQWADYVNGIEQFIIKIENEKKKYEGILDANQKNLMLERENLGKITSELEELESAFLEKLHSRNFADENEFSASYIDSSQLDALRKEFQAITEQISALKSRKTDTEQTLNEKSALKITELTREETKTEFSRYDTNLKELNGKIAVLGQKLKDLAEIQAKIQELTRSRDKQKIDADRWAELNGLIGSSSGDKFRIIAQQTTLALVVNNANIYLQNMSGRYILRLRPESEKLELSVIDNEQAGEIRPTENLSGGERFIISLALALGLSQISGSKARVDSLFLDEGFGSLDEEALNTALDALGEIKREGRMIGIISHVAALRERIAAQIRVIPKREGVSVIEGPGCERVN